MTLRHSILLAILLFPFISNSQTFKLKEGVKLDTVYVSLSFADEFELDLQNALLVQFDSVVSFFNRHDKSLVVKVDSSKSNKSINFTMGPIKYVDWKRNVWVTGLDIAMIGANILILPYFPPVIPFYLMPATISKVEVNDSPGIFAKPTKIYVNPNGYLRKREKQTLRFQIKFDKVFYSFFSNLSKQNIKNNKP